MSWIVEALFQFVADRLAEPLRRKLQRKLGGRTLWGYLKAGRPATEDDLPPLPPKWRRRLGDSDNS
jgi:hypothetical protein